MGQLLNTFKFEDLVDFYDLEKEILYFKLYNKSPFINSYHGWEHVKRIICSIHEISKINKLPHISIKNLMTAGIFHDFDYIGALPAADENEKTYDSKNIQAAINAYNTYLNNCRKYPDFDVEVVRQLILASEYPKCLDASNLNLLESLFIDCDRSMLIHDGYQYMCVLFCVNECNMDDQKEIQKKCLNYLNVLKFNNEHFQRILDQNKNEIEENIVQFTDHMPIPELIRFRHNMTGWILAEEFNFEVIE